MSVIQARHHYVAWLGQGLVPLFVAIAGFEILRGLGEAFNGMARSRRGSQASPRAFDAALPQKNYRAEEARQSSVAVRGREFHAAPRCYRRGASATLGRGVWPHTKRGQRVPVARDGEAQSMVATVRRASSLVAVSRERAFI